MHKKLNDAERREVIEKINGEYEADLEMEGTLLEKPEKRGARKIFLYTGDFLPKVPAEWTGSHLCTIRENDVILSIEGAQAAGKTAEKVIDLSREDAEDVMAGRDMEIETGKAPGYYILKMGKDVIGIGKIGGNRIINQTPKSRRTRKQYVRGFPHQGRG